MSGGLAGAARAARDATTAMPTLELASGRPDFRQAREGSVWTDIDGRVCGRSYIGRDRRWLDWFETGVLAFTDRSPRVQVWPASGVTLDDVEAEFERMLRSIVLQAQGWQALHAGAALTPDGAVLFCGPTGSGKSTTAYAFGQIGWRQLADDQVVWRFDGRRARMLQLPFTPVLPPISQVHLAGPAAPLRHSGGDGLIPIVAIYVLHQRTGRDRPAAISRIPPARAFSQLLPYAHCFDVKVEATRSFTGDYLTLAHDVPVFTLAYSPDLERLPELMHAIVSSASGMEPAPVDVLARSR